MAGLNQLTDTKIKSLTLKGDGFHADGGNLYLRIRGKGRSWVFRFKIPLKAKWASPDERGKPVEIGLGSYPALTLQKARDKREEYAGDIANGVDPRLRSRLDEDDLKTFEQYAVDYIAKAESGWKNAKHKQQWRNTLADYVYPAIGKKLAANIKRDDIYQTLLPLWEAGKFETFSRVRMRIETVLDYAYHDLDIDRRNPARWQGNLKISFGNVSPRTKAKAAGKLKSHAAPPWQECPAIMASLRDKPNVTSALALRFSICTAARSMEARAMTWGEVELDKAVWRLAGDRTKNEEAHAVPLCGEAVAILKGLAKKEHKPTDRVFAGPNGGLLSDVSINKILHAAMPGITAHGIARSSFRDWAAEATSFPDKIAEAALNHKNPNETEAAYLRTKFFAKRVELMKAWGDFLAGKDNVVQLAASA